MAAITRAQLMKELLPGLNALFGLEYKRYEEEHKEIYDIENSERSFEEEVKLSGFSNAPVKPEGAALVYDAGQEAYISRYSHETIALGFALTEEAVEDNLYDSLSARYTKALARAMAYTKQVKAANVLNNGFSNVGGDGVSLFNTSHPLTGGGVNATTPVSAADLSETTLESAVIQINQWVDERGLLIVAKPRKLIISPQLQFVATRLLDTELRTSITTTGPTTFAPNDVNAIKNNGIFPEGYVVNHYLTTTDAYYIKTDVPNGLKMFVRVPMKTGMDSDFDTGNARYKARERYSFGYSDYLGVWGMPQH